MQVTYSSVLFALEVIMFLTLVVFVGRRRENMMDVGQLKRRYQLTVKLFHENANWDGVQSITDLVVPIPSPFWYHKVVDGLLSYTIDHTTLKTKYLDSVLADTVLNCQQKSIAWNLSLLKNLDALNKKKFTTNIDSHKQTIISCLEKMTLNAFDLIQKELLTFDTRLTWIEENAIPPIDDLTRFTDSETSCLIADEYIAAFNEQVKTNLGRLESLDPISKLSSSYIFTITTIGSNTYLSDFNVKEKLHVLKGYLIMTKAHILDLLDYVQGHLAFCTNTLQSHGDISLEFFRNVKIYQYLTKHKNELENLFSPTADHTFPLTTIHVTQLSEKPVTIMSEQDFERFKLSYQQLRQVATRMSAMIPKEFPSELPNLSTYNGKPKLLLGREDDFISVLASYSEYTRKLENLKKCWSSSLRVLSSALEGME